MQLTVILYATRTSTTPIKSISAISECTVTDNVSEISTAKIEFPYDVTGLEALQWVEVVATEAGVDTTIFRGFIDRVTASLQSVTIDAKSEKAVMKRKLATTDRTLSAVTASAAITTLLTDWNSAYGELFTCFSTIATTITKTVEKGDNLYDIIEEIAGMVGAVWDVADGVIRIEALLGTDYTDPSNFKEITYDAQDPFRSNLLEVSAETYGTLANVIIASDSASKTTVSDATSISNVGPYGEYKTFRAGDLAVTANGYLASKKDAQFAFSVVPDGVTFIAEAGDQVQLTIENVSDYLNFSGSVIVNTKTTKLTNGTLIASYSVSDAYAYRDGLLERLVQLRKDLDLARL